MKTYYITFRSATYAQRGESLFNRAGIRCAVHRTPRWMESQGCGYALWVRTEDIAYGVGLLRQQALPMRRVYVQNGEGVLEEVTI